MGREVSKNEAYIDKLTAQLKEWAAKITRLEAKAGRVDADTRIKYSREIEKLRNKRDEAEIKIRELKRASGDAWEELKEGTENTWNEIKNTFDNVFSKIK